MAQGFKGLILATAAVLVLIVMYSVIPLVGNATDEAANIPSGSDWNSTENTDIEKGSDLWADVGGIINITAVILVIAILLVAIMAFQKRA